jgi:hypothetical protein
VLVFDESGTDGSLLLVHNSALAGGAGCQRPHACCAFAQACVLFERRFHWAALAVAALEGPLVVASSVWLLGLAERYLDRRPGRPGSALARSAFAACILQGVVLIGLALALRDTGRSAEVKVPLVATGGVVGSFAFAWLLVAHTRLGRLLWLAR